MRTIFLALILLLALAGCAPSPTTEPAAGTAVAAAPTVAATATMAAAAQTPTPSPEPSPTGTRTPTPTDTPTLTPTSTPTPTVTPRPTATAIPLCQERTPAANDLLPLVSHEYGLSAAYRPDDLVALGDYFPSAVTRGYPTQVRALIIAPLQELIAAMHEAELRPFVVSGFRSYYDQAAARNKWAEQFPDWVQNISARAGHSEHQLGTTVDFSTPDLPTMVGEPFIEFHPAFAVSGEGKWLAAHAHDYGFTMSYPDGRYEETGFNYEPWHFRYVGPELAALLYENHLTISEYLLDRHGPPCQP